MKLKALVPLTVGTTILVACHQGSALTRNAVVDRLEYRGFVVDLTPIHSAANRAASVKAIRTQFDIVADLTIDGRVQAFFRSIPFTIDSVAIADPGYRGPFASYCATTCARASERGRIKFAPKGLTVGDPIFLHELLHAYQDQKLLEGGRNSAILELHSAARAGHLWADSLYVMFSPQEYFAAMGSAYLWGKATSSGRIARDTIRIRQPALYEWFVKEFGRR